jgi:hypothetical protein
VSTAWIKGPVGAIVLAFAAVVAVSALAAPYTVDDAFIVARYAQNLATGGGYAMNPGIPSDGVTGPLWIAPSFLAVQLGLSPVLASKLTGALCAALAAALTVFWAHRRALGWVASWASACVLGSLPDVGTWAVSGLETGAALLGMALLAGEATTAGCSARCSCTSQPSRSPAAIGCPARACSCP